MKDALLRPVTFFFALLLFLATGPLLSAQAQFQKVTYDLEAQSNNGAFPNGVDATATFWEFTDDQTVVTLELDGGATGADVAHPAHIHNNSASEGGSIEIYLTPIDGSGGGGTSARIVNRSFDDLKTFDGYINIHESVDSLGNVVSQGNIGANADSSVTNNGLEVVDNPRSAQYDLAANANDGAFPNGVPAAATFQEVTSGMTFVSLDFDLDGATGADSISHPAHIHNNSAEEGGSIEYYLGPIDGTDPDSRSGKLVTESYDTLTEFDGYINIHQSVATLGEVVSQGNIGSNSVVEPPPSGSFELLADSSQLAPGNAAADIQCLTRPASDLHVFFNAEAEGIYAWDGSSLIEHRSASDLNSDVPDEDNNFDSCDGAVTVENRVYFILRSSETNDNYVYKTQTDDASATDFVSFGGANGLTATTTEVYIAGYEFFGSPDDGIWQVDTDASGDFDSDTSRVSTNSDLSIDAVDVENQTLYGYSNSFGSGDLSETIFSLDVSSSSPSFQPLTSPYESGVFATDPSGEGNDSILDVEATTYNDTEYVVILNNSRSAPDGEEVGAIEANNPSEQSILFRESGLQENLSVSGYDASRGEPLSVNSDGEVSIASRGDFTYLALVTEPPPLPVEMAGFDAVQNDNSVELTWQTASETNNAGFRVQHRAPNAESWNGLGFVESEASGGTATESVSYRYAVDRELEAGTHRFRLKQKDLDGSTSLSDVVTVDVTMDGALSLSAPVPNPVTETATISFGVREATEATMSVYNVLGQRVKTLYQGTPQAGEMNEVTFDADAMPSGVYFVRMQADGQTRTERLTVVR